MVKVCFGLVLEAPIGFWLVSTECSRFAPLRLPKSGLGQHHGCWSRRKRLHVSCDDQNRFASSEYFLLRRIAILRQLRIP